jgi:hypothetical protein
MQIIVNSQTQTSAVAVDGSDMMVMGTSDVPSQGPTLLILKAVRFPYHPTRMTITFILVTLFLFTFVQGTLIPGQTGVKPSVLTPPLTSSEVS